MKSTITISGFYIIHMSLNFLLQSISHGLVFIKINWFTLAKLRFLCIISQLTKSIWSKFYILIIQDFHSTFIHFLSFYSWVKRTLDSSPKISHLLFHSVLKNWCHFTSTVFMSPLWLIIYLLVQNLCRDWHADEGTVDPLSEVVPGLYKRLAGCCLLHSWLPPGTSCVLFNPLVMSHLWSVMVMRACFSAPSHTAFPTREFI